MIKGKQCAACPSRWGGQRPHFMAQGLNISIPYAHTFDCNGSICKCQGMSWYEEELKERVGATRVCKKDLLRSQAEIVLR